jgi:hypothetical protein
MNQIGSHEFRRCCIEQMKEQPYENREIFFNAV